MSDPGRPDQEVSCVKCGNPFRFSADDQAYHAARGHADDRKRCPACRPVGGSTAVDAPPRRPLWEYRELTIPLDFSTRGRAHHEAAARFEQTAGASLGRAGGPGWQADGPADWWSLWAGGRVKLSWRQGFFAALVGGRGTWTYESVSVRLKRIAA
jgi:hypothetical protein